MPNAARVPTLSEHRSNIRDAIVRLRKVEQLLSARDEIVNMLLYFLESYIVAAFTFKVTEKRCQAWELAVTTAIRAMIKLFAMGRRV